MLNINGLLDIDKISGIGIENPKNIKRCFDENNKEAISSLSDGEIIIYIYFKELVDLSAIQIDCPFNCYPFYANFYRFNTEICFEDMSLKPDVSLRVFDDQRHFLKMQNVDYLTLFLKRQDSISILNITFYGQLNKRNKRKLDKVLIKWHDSDCIELDKKIAIREGKIICN